MKLKCILFALALILNTLFSPVKATTVNGILDEYDFGSWAMRQHYDVSELVYKAIKNNQLTKFTVQGKSLNKTGVLNYFEQKATVFISTDMNDPTKGRDSNIMIHNEEKFYSIGISTANIEIKVTQAGQSIRFDLKEFYSILNEEQKLYLKYYGKSGLIVFEKLPEISRTLTQELNIKLHLEGRQPKTVMYKTDSLLSTFSLPEKDIRGYVDHVAFISTDPNDPAIGRDTIYYTPLLEQLQDKNTYQFIFYLLKPENHDLNLVAVSCGFQPFFGGAQGRPNPYGFLKFNEVLSVNNDDKTLITFLIAHHLQNNFKPYFMDFEEYIKTFKIKSMRLEN